MLPPHLPFLLTLGPAGGVALGFAGVVVGCVGVVDVVAEVTTGAALELTTPELVGVPSGEDGRTCVEEEEEEEAPPQFPNSGLHPVPQWSGVVPQ